MIAPIDYRRSGDNCLDRLEWLDTRKLRGRESSQGKVRALSACLCGCMVICNTCYV